MLPTKRLCCICSGPRSEQRPEAIAGLLSQLKACSSTKDLQRGKQLHAEAAANGSVSFIFVATALASMYAKCGSMDKARLVFDSTKNPDVALWNTLILGYAENGKGSIGLDMFAKMKTRGCTPNHITFLAAVKACTSLALEQGGCRRAESRERGRQIHLEVGKHSHICVQNSLIDMYAKCGSMADARQVFDGIQSPDVVSWNALILGYAENGKSVIALELFAKMKSQGRTPNSTTFVAALKACSSLALEQGRAECREHGRLIHSEVGPHMNIYVQCSLIDMYAKCGSMADARRVFEDIKRPSVASWNALILGYAENGEGMTALDLFDRMRSQGCLPNFITYLAALKACTSLALEQDASGRMECRNRGRELHLQIGCHSNIYVQSTLIDMYSKCGSMAEARKVFEAMKNPNVVTWNALIMGYADNGEGVTALDLFTRMKSEGFSPDSVTYLAAFKACGSLGALEPGSKIHAEMNTATEAVLVTCLVDFYSKCGNLVEAQRIFDSHSQARELKTWTALLAGYSRLGDTDAVLRLFDGMQDAGFQPNSVTFLCILTCCSHAGLVEKAREFFEAMSTKHRIAPTLEHYTCMVDILGRSCMLDDAMALLHSMPFGPDSVTWMIVLGSCHKWKSLGVGRLAFKSLVSLDETNAFAYVLLADIYRSRGMWEEQDMVLEMRDKCNARKELGQSCWTSEAGDVHTFQPCLQT